MGMSIAYIALGGNVGDVRTRFIAARGELDSLPGMHIRASSLLYTTPPLGPDGQADYLNAMIAVATSMTPLALLEVLQGIENRNGRLRKERWGPRTLDLDIIAFNDIEQTTAALTLPHKEMHKRQFVLRPLCDLDANWQHPRVRKSAQTLLDDLLQTG
ncbi:MAG: 2-amino-4-hydroxy-6-hydroxymethyldihydropteridine diphosphokinase, partial [Mariprofundaceae bacterium]